MQSLLAQAQAAGFHLLDALPDSKVHRFPRRPGEDKDAWYVCHQAHSRAGNLFHILILGDWHETEIHKFNTLKGASKDDLSYIAAQIKEAQARAEKEQQKLWEETAERAGREWAQFDKESALCPYLLAKQIHYRDLGIRFDKDAVLIPVQDVTGKLWGWQRITATEKKFLYGCKVQGNFHTLGALEKEAILVEGYATGASIHEATGKTVLVGFNAGNLPRVAQAVLAAHPNLKLIVAADDDQWTDGNPGVTAANKCAARKVIKPRFKDTSSKPTDFNDLHVLEGLDAVKQQILGDKSPRQYILFLGHKGDDYYYSSSSNRQIVKISRSQHNQSNLLDLMPMNYWEGRFTGQKGVNWALAQDNLQQQCRLKGIYDEENIRGLGVWRDSIGYLINLGDSLYAGKERLSVDDLDSKFVYEIGKRLPEPDHSPLDLTLLPSLIEKISFKHHESRIFFLGLLTVAPVAGALHWRPHGWINGSSGTGKSTIMQVVSQILGGYKHYFQGQTTEAGIRQTTRNDAKAVMIDEFEAEEENGVQRIQRIIELLRQASSETDGHIAKGSAGGNAVSARPKFSAILCSIRQQNLNEADRARITDFELERLKNPEKFDEFKELAARITPEYANAYISRTYRLMPVLQATIELFWDVLRRQHSARVGQQYGTLLAGWWIATNEEVPERAHAEALCRELKLEQTREGEAEEMECLDHLMNSLVTLPGGVKMAVRELASETEVKNLTRHGMIREEKQFWVAVAHPELKRIFKDTKWAGGWSKSLARLKGAVKKSKYYANDGEGKAAHSVGIPIEFVLEKKLIE